MATRDANDHRPERTDTPATDTPAPSGVVGPAVVDNRDASRFELTVDGHVAVLNYERTPKSLVLVHTEVPEPLRGRRLGDALVTGAIAAGRAEGLKLVAVCPFVRAYLRKHPQPDMR